MEQAEGKEIRYWDDGWTPEGHVTVPLGYVGLAPGDHFVTRRVKQLALEQGRDIYVRMQKGRKKEYSQIVVYHVPPELLAQAREEADQTRARREAARRQAAAGRERRHERFLEEARVALLKLYPKVPEDEAEQVVRHAFEVGSGRVGRSGKLALDEKLRLAAVAHVRHVHTDYERLLDTMEKEDARAEIQADVRDKLREWGGSG